MAFGTAIGATQWLRSGRIPRYRGHHIKLARALVPVEHLEKRPPGGVVRMYLLIGWGEISVGAGQKVHIPQH